MRFANYGTRVKVYGAKKNLKGTSIVIREDLTGTRLKLIKEAVETYGSHNVWTMEGNIFAREDNAVIRLKM